jgi:hypothetical protein
MCDGIKWNDDKPNGEREHVDDKPEEITVVTFYNNEKKLRPEYNR